MSHILLEAGTYPLISPLLIGRSVVLEAAQPGTVVLYGLGVSRVLSIAGGGIVDAAAEALGVEELSGLTASVEERRNGMPAVELIGLNITRGFALMVTASLSLCGAPFPPSGPLLPSVDSCADAPCCARGQ